MIAVAAVLAVSAVLILTPASPRVRLRVIRQRTQEHAAAGRPHDVDSRADRRAGRLLTVAVVVGATGIALVIGGVGGLLAGIAGGATGLWLLRHGSVEAGDDAEVARALPQVADLLAATVAAGATLPDAVDATARATGGPAGSALRRASAALALGATTQEAWRRAGPAFAPVGVAFARSAQSGAALAELLAALADDIRRERRVAVEVAARAAGVKAVAPLVVCFLPAFVLVGVVPVVVSLASELLG